MHRRCHCRCCLVRVSGASFKYESKAFRLAVLDMYSLWSCGTHAVPLRSKVDGGTHFPLEDRRLAGLDDHLGGDALESGSIVRGAIVELLFVNIQQPQNPYFSCLEESERCKVSFTTSLAL